MYLFTVLSLIIWVCVCLVSGATFSAVGNVVGSDIFLCGKEVVLMCSETDTILSLTLTVYGKQVVGCAFPTCTPNPEFAANFSMDETKGIFNFTLNTVKSSDNGLKFICKVNELEHMIAPKIAEIPQNNSLVIQNKTVQAGIEIKAITGCVFPTSSISFRWYTVKVSNESDVKSFDDHDSRTEPNNNQCTQLPDCKGSGLSNTFVIQQGGNSMRGEVYLEVRVIHNYSEEHLIAVQRTTYSFIIPDPITTTQTASPTTKTDITTDITTATTNFSPSQSRTSSVTKSSTSEMKTTTTTTNANPNTNLPTSTSLLTTTEEPRKSDNLKDKLILVYIFAPLGLIILMVIIIYVICVNFRKQETKETNNVI